MTPCMLLSDRIPEVAAGRSRWTADDERHLAGCADCRAEWDLLRAAARLADSYRAPDPSATAAAVTQHLRTARSSHRGRRTVWVTAVLAAAVVAFVVWSGLGRDNPVRPVSPPAIAVAPPPTAAAPTPADHAPAAPSGATDGFPIPELDSLSTEALDSMLRVLDEPLARAAAWELPDVGDPGDQLLEQAITGREG
ncbi:MAG TPA: hypothetical protein VF046_03075 [Gemmatimonadales bacterium]